MIDDLRAALPDADIYVYDNNSKDRTVAIAASHGHRAQRAAARQRAVARRMFADVEADAYVLVDGDAPYHAPGASKMVSALLDKQFAMVVGRRVDELEAAYRRGHRRGNRALTDFLSLIFGQQFREILSGYRLFSRCFVTYAELGFVPRMPTALLCTGPITLSKLAVRFGLVLDTVTRGRRGMKLQAY